MSKETDTCREYVVPELKAAGWDSDHHSIPRKTHNHPRENDLKRQDHPAGRDEANRLPSPQYSAPVLAVANATDDCKSPGFGLGPAKLDYRKAPQHKIAITLESLLPNILGAAFKGVL